MEKGPRLEDLTRQVGIGDSGVESNTVEVLAPIFVASAAVGTLAGLLLTLGLWALIHKQPFQP